MWPGSVYRVEREKGKRKKGEEGRREKPGNNGGVSPSCHLDIQEGREKKEGKKDGRDLDVPLSGGKEKKGERKESHATHKKYESRAVHPQFAASERKVEKKEKGEEEVEGGVPAAPPPCNLFHALYQ